MISPLSIHSRIEISKVRESYRTCGKFRKAFSYWETFAALIYSWWQQVSLSAVYVAAPRLLIEHCRSLFTKSHKSGIDLRSLWLKRSAAGVLITVTHYKMQIHMNESRWLGHKCEFEMTWKELLTGCLANMSYQIIFFMNQFWVFLIGEMARILKPTVMSNNDSSKVLFCPHTS